MLTATGNGAESTNGAENLESSQNSPAFCRDFIRGLCIRENCRYVHENPPKHFLKEIFRFCHDFQNKGCFRINCKFLHGSHDEEEAFYSTGIFPRDLRNVPVCQSFLHGSCVTRDCNFLHPPDKCNGTPAPTIARFHVNRPPPFLTDDDFPTRAKLRRFALDDSISDIPCLPPPPGTCLNCERLDHKNKLLHENISVLLKKVADLTEKNVQLTTVNEVLLEQTASMRNEQPCVITSRHCTSAPVSLATVSVTPVVSYAGALPALVPAGTTSNITLAPTASQAQLLTPASQILTGSTTQQLMGNSGTLIVTSAGAQQLMQVRDSGTLMAGGQTVVAVTPAQLTLAPPTQQLMSSASQAAVQQLVQQSAPQLVQPQLTAQQQAQQFAAAQQSVQHLAAAQQSAQHLAAAAQQSAQQLAAQQSAQQQLVQPTQQLVHQTGNQQLTIASSSQALALPNSQAQPITFPMISQSLLHH